MSLSDRKFCAFILTHGRPTKVTTYSTLRRHGYTGPVYFVVDDEDPALPEYRDRFGADHVLVFSKAQIAQEFDEGDNSFDRRSIVYARNACWGLARELGIEHFIQLDDDYHDFQHTFDEDGRWAYVPMENLDGILDAMVDFHQATPFASVAMSQGGDHIAGGLASSNETISTKRKAMNTFICDTSRPFMFQGRINEDVNTYTEAQRRGVIFLTFMAVKIVQRVSQSSSGGMTELYLDSGTYVKSFYSVMYAPSCVTVRSLTDHQKTGVNPEGNRGGRIHHQVKWNATAPKILHERYKKGSRAAQAEASA